MEAETVEDSDFLAHSLTHAKWLMLSQPSYIDKDCMHRTGAAHGGLGPPTLTKKQDNLTQSWPHTNLILAVRQLRFLQTTLRLHKVKVES